MTEGLSSGCHRQGRRKQQRGGNIGTLQYVKEGQVVTFFYDAQFVLRALM